MPTHTIRNKSSATPIVTFKAKQWAEFRKCHPEAVSLTIAWLKKNYKQLTGKNLVLSHEQVLEFYSWVGADSSGIWRSKFSGLGLDAHLISQSFQDGILMSSSLDLETVLRVSNEFFSMMASRFLELPKS